MKEDAKICFLFKKVQCPALESAIQALKAQTTAGTTFTYTTAANHLNTAVSEFPDYIVKSRNISALGNTDKANDDTSPSIHNADDSIKTGYINNWRSLSEDVRNIVKQEQKRLRLQKGSE